MKRSNNHVAQAQAGVSLIELMLAMVLGLLILAGVIQLFIGSKMTYTSNEALARVQENGRFAMELLKRDLRAVSNRGMCAGRINVTSHLNDDCDKTVDTLFDTRHTTVGWEYDGTGRGEAFTLPASLDPAGIPASKWKSYAADGTALSLPDALKKKVVPGSDVLVTRNLNRMDINISGVKNDNQLNVGGGGDTIPPRSIVMVTNCSTGADLFQQSKRQNDSANPTKPTMNCDVNAPGNEPPGQSDWGTQHDENSAVYLISTVAYYVGFNAERGEPSLYRHDFAAEVTEELVMGVENMQVLYGYSNPADQGGDGQSVNYWVPADEVPDWEFVIGARLGLISRSPENLGGDTVQQTFDLISTAIKHPEDGRLRHPFFASVSLRNNQIVM